jgi:hypothetical protein
MENKRFFEQMRVEQKQQEKQEQYELSLLVNLHFLLDYSRPPSAVFVVSRHDNHHGSLL